MRKYKVMYHKDMGYAALMKDDGMHFLATGIFVVHVISPSKYLLGQKKRYNLIYARCSGILIITIPADESLKIETKRP